MSTWDDDIDLLEWPVKEIIQELKADKATILDSLPESRNRSVALTKIDEAIFWIKDIIKD